MNSRGRFLPGEFQCGQLVHSRRNALAGFLVANTRHRKDAYEALYPETKAHVAGAHASNASQGNASANLAPAFTADTAAKTGQPERAVQRDAERDPQKTSLSQVVVVVVAEIAASERVTLVHAWPVQQLVLIDRLVGVALVGIAFAGVVVFVVAMVEVSETGAEASIQHATAGRQAVPPAVAARMALPTPATIIEDRFDEAVVHGQMIYVGKG
jgi:hypothetical protein